MVYKEEERSILTVPNDYYVSYCISADFAEPTNNVVKKLNKKLGILWVLKMNYPEYGRRYRAYKKEGDCIIRGKTLSLVTRGGRSDKSTEESFLNAVKRMKVLALQSNIKKIAFSKTSIDRVKWDVAAQIFQDTFANTDIEILVCV